MPGCLIWFTEKHQIFLSKFLLASYHFSNIIIYHPKCGEEPVRATWFCFRDGETVRQWEPPHSSEREAGMWEQKEALGRAWTVNHLWGTPTAHSCWELFLADSTSAILVLLFPQCHFLLRLTSPLESAVSSQPCFTSFAAPSHPEACESRQCPFTRDSNGQISDAPFGWTSPKALGHCIRSLLKHGALFRFLIEKRKPTPCLLRSGALHNPWTHLLLIAASLSERSVRLSPWVQFLVHSTGGR